MEHLFPTSSPFDQIHIALDLETTGLDINRDAIIEVGAVKFQGDQVIDTFQTFVNPGRAIPEFIQRLTGISPNQVKRAPPFAAIVSNLEAFLESHPIIGHNISFDLSVLSAHGLKLDNPSYDTWDLASVFLPNNMEYSLGRLTDFLNVSHDNHHRALADARAAQGVFLALLRKASNLDSGLVAYIRNLALRSRWAIAPLLSGLEQDQGSQRASLFGLTGLDLDTLASRLERPERRRSDGNLQLLDEERIISLLSPKGPFSQDFRGFEHRPEQEQMLAAVTSAIHQGQHLIVEGGTGVGKSMAYLLPAILFAAAKGQRVVISTNTINLQEQLLNKDIPAVIKTLEEGGILQQGLVKAALLKGRSNYLCLRRWNYLARSESPSVDDARLLSKTAVWLQDTTAGDRGEINLSGKDAFTWSRVSAGDKAWCPGMRDGGPCFLRAARERAEQAHIVVVNHALLLTDLARGGGSIPDYQYLIVDEAHNLEDEATRQFGFQVTPDRLEEDLETQNRVLTQLRTAMRAEDMTAAVRQIGEQVIADIETYTPRLRDTWGQLWSATDRFLTAKLHDGNDDQTQLLLTPRLRGQGGWADLALAWENTDLALQQSAQRLDRLQRFLESSKLNALTDVDTVVMESRTIQENLELAREQLKTVLGAPDDQRILWIARDNNRGDVKLNSAPLEVGPLLSEQLFKKKESVILTSATLSAQGSFDYFRQRVGLPSDESEELLVGSPFDYQKAALLLIPEDMPQPSEPKYIESIARVIIDLGKSLSGRTMSLFTSYSALRAVAQQVRSPLMAEGIEVLAQGTDGSPQQLIRRFSENPRSVLLGTASFWEGVDLPSGVLKGLVLTRLPFQVPSDPIVKARSEQHKDAFNQFSVPQAILRFRQGIGRLIRNKGDKGAIVVLDKRITGRTYGRAFLQSIPPCSLQPSNLNTVGDLAARWVGVKRGTGR